MGNSQREKPIPLSLDSFSPDGSVILGGFCFPIKLRLLERYDLGWRDQWPAKHEQNWTSRNPPQDSHLRLTGFFHGQLVECWLSDATDASRRHKKFLLSHS